MSQKYALITGASSGIGYSVARILAQRGYKVLGCAPEKDLSGMDSLKEYGVVPFALDITNIDQIKKAVEFVRAETGGRLDILYNNAGISIGGPATEIPDDDLVRLFNVNVFGHIYMTKYFIGFVIAAKGRVVFTSSVAARVPLSWIGAYCASKAAIDSYAQALRVEMKPFGVRVHSVITGGVNTAICDVNFPKSFEGSRYDVPGLYDSLKASSTMSRDVCIQPDEYAKQVIRDITGWRDPGFNLYHGARAYTLHILGRFFPVWLVEWGIAFHFKQLKPLREVARRAKKTNTA
ncbi:1-Acyl dihydroxyacetone phosphate reductase ribitol 2-dehydrogenase [Scheffersomyces stipitis CBS 6054]|uniref:1-Acyl dihydroxyacetone phosphate reductase ribitol 2-dehydrogenase n=1 Tax=Scheffersomyces stipitis (strain ATCC 58785 / CBS 6054 / NBRC 10063 / NRRL Y-11545) TaxID=322104 RepID=A3GHL5_PICST|nr:1-Acyl dihydroxyacetone phosphate reductase ribitol 2-dehydrogenase [Scheffersomyces stipitis CBS 6054]EAZ62841.2 1-Acyl dihydroxyacetone phosphate reductase ribitol 2-dehydrogenase [Scheffersomyces stipitis CBS 6054]KAG2735374.1 hypothetical protein G9P44_001588 [Scheffersomyces stipitis]